MLGSMKDRVQVKAGPLDLAISRRILLNESVRTSREAPMDPSMVESGRRELLDIGLHRLDSRSGRNRNLFISGTRLESFPCHTIHDILRGTRHNRRLSPRPVAPRSQTQSCSRTDSYLFCGIQRLWG